jgi:glycosyltransferase involved in cell wall biosynthesis
MKKVVLVLPVYNEEKILKDSVNKLYNYFKKNIKYDWKIIISNNSSTDKTKEIADKLTKRFSRVKAIHLKTKGRGNALVYAWANYNADVYAYCDTDLATDISHLKELFDSIIKENYNLAIGNRYLENSNSKRNMDRWLYSKVYIYLVKLLFKTKINDFQCGFKAIDKKVLKEIIPKIKDKKWFFDTELLLRAEKLSYKIKQIPITWNETRKKDSRVNIPKTSIDYILNIIKLKKELK